MWRMHPDTWGYGFGTLDNAAVEDVARNDEVVDDVFDAEAFVHGCGQRQIVLSYLLEKFYLQFKDEESVAVVGYRNNK